MIERSIWLEVKRDNGAILSYFLEQPGLPPESVFYVPATKAELAYLNGLEDAILPAGMVATLSDLEAHRARVDPKATTSTKAPATAPTKAVQSASKSSNTQPSIDSQRAKASFIAALKQHRSNK
ncbi:hypothetical protein CQ065_17005 [Pseudomonas sp. MYb187]|uniref:hypothetical protein n=1 Tax=Pseudomonas TaxID=286 RepID=UPI000CFD209C|nr:hypothetical protein [Pseudomonas sp. MYb187]PRA61963.1 hypothetical protein CQ065_17005 [Pseudomonas sp. MYb187]